ncbi:MAG: Mur ligase domain-containing protein, partial [Acidimicrobiales bacterium]
MRLDALLAETRALVILEPAEAGSVEVTSVVHDTREVTQGALYCCVPGENVDGHDLAPDAAAAGASALLVERAVDVPLPQLLARSVREAMGPIADAFWDHPSDALTLVGVTGTSGKTTTTHLLHAIFQAHGWSSSVLGTLSGPRTTPEATELQAHLAAE